MDTNQQQTYSNAIQSEKDNCNRQIDSLRQQANNLKQEVERIRTASRQRIDTLKQQKQQAKEREQQQKQAQSESLKTEDINIGAFADDLLNVVSNCHRKLFTLDCLCNVALDDNTESETTAPSEKTVKDYTTKGLVNNYLS